MIRPKVDKNKCIGCGLCVSICPQVFELGDDGKSKIINPNACEGCNCKEAAESCPAQAIILEKE